MQITPENNIFHVVANEMVRTGKAECYLEIGESIATIAPSDAMQRVFNRATAFSQDPAWKCLAAHFNTARMRSSHPFFAETLPLHGEIAVGDTPLYVSFSLRRVHANPVTYRILFTQRAAQLPAEDLELLRDRVHELEARMQALETGRQQPLDSARRHMPARVPPGVTA